MGVHRIAATEMPQDRSAIDTGGFTATVGEFDAPEGHGDWHHHGDHHIIAYIISGDVRSTRPTGDAISPHRICKLYGSPQLFASRVQ